MTVQELEAAFHVYLPQLEGVRVSKAYWPVLHMLLSLPDICAALESPSGETSGELYIAWCDRYLPGHSMNGADWYKLRCAVLHLGSSLPDQKRGKHRSQYSSFSFVDPDSGPPGYVHGQIRTDPAGDSNISLDVAELADSMVCALRMWFRHVTDLNHPQLAIYVAKNLPALVRVQPKDFLVAVHVGPGPGFMLVEHRGITTSST